MTDYFHLDMPRDDIGAISTLGLAHLGDAVYELMVRSWLCLHGKATNKGLHKAAVGYVAASAQAASLCWDGDRFIRGFTEEDQRIGAAADPEANLWLNPQSWA